MIATEPNVTANIEIIERDTLVLICTINHTMPTTYMWRKHGKPMQGSNYLQVLNTMNRNDSGSYQCEVTGGNITKISNIVNVDVYCKLFLYSFPPFIYLSSQTALESIIWYE